MPRNSYFENNYPFPVHNPKFKEKHAMLYTKHKTKPIYKKGHKESHVLPIIMAADMLMALLCN